MGDAIRMANVTGVPTRGGSEFYINPAQIPAGALLFIGQSPVGKPSGLPGLPVRWPPATSPIPRLFRQLTCRQ